MSLHTMYVSAGEEMDYDSLLRLRGCLGVFSKVEATLSNDNCPMVFDSWSCWNSTAPGTVQEQPCPNFPHLGFSPKSKLNVCLFVCLNGRLPDESKVGISVSQI